MAGFQRESEAVLHVGEDSNSAESSDESKPKRQRSAGKTIRSTMDQQNTDQSEI